MKITIDEVRTTFLNAGHILLSTEYINRNIPLLFICGGCGQESKSSYCNVKFRGTSCKTCGDKKSAKTRSNKIDKITEECEKRGYKLISTEYINRKTKIEVICPCGNKYETLIGNVLRENRCKTCGNKAVSTKLRGRKKDKENRPLSQKMWAYKVKDRDESSCIICGSKNRVNAHHIFSFTEYPTLRNVVENGVSLCHFHHKEFHISFNKNSQECTLAQFEEYYKQKQKCHREIDFVTLGRVLLKYLN